MDRHLLRIEKLRGFLEAAGCDAFLLNHPPSLNYYCGYSGDSAWLLVDRRRCFFYTDGRYTTQAAAEIPAAIELNPIKTASHLFQLLGQHFTGTAIGIDENHLCSGSWLKLRESLKLEPRPAANWLVRARLHKDREEIELLRRAAAIAEEALAATLPCLKAGTRERDLAAELEYQIRRAGGERTAFPLIVASGPRSALPHGVAAERIIADGDPVTIDFGAVYRGYHSDQTCTFFLGEPTAEQAEVYHTLLKAQEAGFQALGENTPPSAFQLDKTVRQVLTKAGLETAFSHGTGHGIGLEIHEAPSISPAAGNEPLTAGMVFTIEPGCYFPNRWGIRIEDTIHLTEKGPVKLTTIDKSLERMIIA